MPAPSPWREIYCPFTHPEYPRGHLASYNADSGTFSCAVCDKLCPATEVESLIDESLQAFSDRYPGLREIDPRIAREFSVICRGAFAHRLDDLELGTILLAYGHSKYPHVAPAYLRSLIADAILGIQPESAQ